MALDVTRTADYFSPMMGVAGNTDGGADAFAQLMNVLGTNKGLFGLGDAATGGLLSGASALLGGIGGLLMGPTDQEKRAKKVFNMAENRMGQNVLDPSQYMADFQRATADQFNQQAEGINKRLNLDSGVAQGALAENMQGTLAKFMLNAKMQNDVLKSQNDNMLMQLMASLSR